MALSIDLHRLASLQLLSTANFTDNVESESVSTVVKKYPSQQSFNKFFMAACFEKVLYRNRGPSATQEFQDCFSIINEIFRAVALLITYFTQNQLAMFNMIIVKQFHALMHFGKYFFS